MDLEERKLFEESLVDLIEATPARDRQAALDDFGWTDLLSTDPADAVDIVGSLIGARALSEHALDAVLLASVESRASAVVLPTLGSAEPSSRATITDDILQLDIRGVVVAREETPSTVVIPALLNDSVALITIAYGGAWPSSGTGIAPEAGIDTFAATMQLPLGEAHIATSGWTIMRAAAYRLLARELVSGARSMLTMAVEHVSSREQFGRKLASFQAVKHKLADVRHWIEVADLAISAAQEDDDGDASRVSKALANRASAAARENCQQVLGGMGFTWEYDFHWLAKRGLLLEPLLGSTTALRSETGERILKDPALTTRLVRL